VGACARRGDHGAGRMSVLPRALARSLLSWRPMAHAGEEPRAAGKRRTGEPPWAFAHHGVSDDVRGGGQLHVGHRRRRTGTAAPRSALQLRVGRRRSAYVGWAFRAAKRSLAGDADRRRCVGHHPVVRRGCRGEPRVAPLDVLCRGRVRAHEPRRTPTSTLVGAGWPSGRVAARRASSGSARVPTAAIATSSAVPSRR
jgi:hypothetical protein